ncbi:uncharacterized protein LOC129948801 [Eupeodes corollae]|uniref:uncharacterized protein LOC129948801 n=1 Tax=Eupeodes corollae TaxID=290404 RepID=UPI0024904448|nr:uncharacterized protein LOC129948801 [Eupeodes corollae]
MHPSNFFQNQHNSRERNYQSNFPNFQFNTAELYPRRRHTEFYYQTSIPEEFQSRSFEHPPILDSPDPLWNEEQHRKAKINPPKNSSMRIVRDSYFS